MLQVVGKLGCGVTVCNAATGACRHTSGSGDGGPAARIADGDGPNRRPEGRLRPPRAGGPRGLAPRSTSRGFPNIHKLFLPLSSINAYACLHPNNLLHPNYFHASANFYYVIKECSVCCVDDQPTNPSQPLVTLFLKVEDFCPFSHSRTTSRWARPLWPTPCIPPARH